jgi:hypothetical protein
MTLFQAMTPLFLPLTITLPGDNDSFLGDDASLRGDVASFSVVNDSLTGDTDSFFIDDASLRGDVTSFRKKGQARTPPKRRLPERKRFLAALFWRHYSS